MDKQIIHDFVDQGLKSLAELGIMSMPYDNIPYEMID